jgi:pimeloyl-ACP methyl ester carboxylesterase
MPNIRQNGLEIAYLDEGAGQPVVLLHRIASNKVVDWVATQWCATLRQAGRRIIAPDCRGHGASTKFYTPADYSGTRMAADVRALLDRLGIERADFLGYEMGARIAAFFAIANPARVRSLILAGMGINLVEGSNREFRFAAALEVSPAQVTDPLERSIREFAERNRCDIKAVAACFRGARPLTREQVATVRVATLVAAGTQDEVALREPNGGASVAQGLARLIPGAKALDLAGRDHFGAIADPAFMRGVLEFLARRP